MQWSQQWPKVLQKLQKLHCNEYLWILDSWQYLKDQFVPPVRESLIAKSLNYLLFLFLQLFLFHLDRNSPLWKFVDTAIH